MSSLLLGLLFVALLAASLVASQVMVSAIEALADRHGLSEAILGMLAALAADAPEITTAATALVRHQPTLGAGVVIGSNVFNLAALLGLGAVVAGGLVLHRRVVLLSGGVATWVAVVCLLTLLVPLRPLVGLLLVLLVLVPYIALGAQPRARLASLATGSWSAWLTSAMAEEDTELEDFLPERHGRVLPRALGALAVVVLASIEMERAGSDLGTRWSVPGILTGGLVLAAATSVPNAVAAIYLARRGRGAAVLSTAFNSNAINVALGLLAPATLTGLGAIDWRGQFVASSYLALTVGCVLVAWRAGALRRSAGLMILGAYLGFVVALVVITR